MPDPQYIILDLLRSGVEKYGLQLVDESEGALKRGAIYVNLHRMMDKKLIKSRAEEVEGMPGMPRRFYSLTALGQATLAGEDAKRAAMGGLGYARRNS